MNLRYLILLVVAGIFLSSCSAVKYVPKDEHLLTKNTIFINGNKNVDDEITGYIVQRPNQLVLGFPFPLHFYNVGNKDFETDFEKWKEKHPKRYNFTTKIFSEKQYRGIRKFKYKRHQWWLKNGEEPSILNKSKTKQTIENLRQHFYNEGFLKAKVTAEYDYSERKRVKVNYFVTTNKLYKIDSISTNIKSKPLDSIYNISKDESIIKKGDPFKLSLFVEERERLTKLFRNSGVYRFNKNTITFEADSSNFANYKSNIDLLITDSILSAPFKIQKVMKTKVYTDYSFQTKNQEITDTLNYKGFTFLSREKLKYKPDFLANLIYIDSNSIYKDESTQLTRKSFRDLKLFRSVNIRYDEIENDDLEASIFLNPLKKYGLELNAEITHSNERQFGILGMISFLNRNTFKRGEIFKFSIQGAFSSSKDVSDKQRFLNGWEIGSDIQLEIPRFLIPFKKNKRLKKAKSPKTIFTIGTSLQKNIGLDKQRFTGIIDYTWETSKTKSHSFQFFNAQFIQNINPGHYFYIYESEFSKLQTINDSYFNDVTLNEDNALQFINDNITSDFEQNHPEDYKIAKNVEERNSIITEDVLIPSMAYTFTYNNRENYKDDNFSYFRARVASSGGIFTTVTNNLNENNVKTIFDIPIAQYIRTDIEYKKFWEMSANNILAYRVFMGVAIPYGNSQTIPFNRNYFIGGPNDLRAWKVYDLGPGASQTNLEYNVGNLKFLTSLEYRFEILNSLKGALFVDAGNIWDITNSSIISESGKFKNFDSIKNIAIGSGFGIRYDLSFILLRFDFGFKTYEPYNAEGEKWLQNYNFANTVFHFGISYPF